ncbi:hypothetical protein WA158_007546 [Blastocystis sp. Blastoise]
MFEARLIQGSLLKKLVEAMKELITDANLDCSSNGISLQAMDSSHVSLCALTLRKEGFEQYRCDKSTSLGLKFSSVSKILKCADNEDTITLKAEDEGDAITFVFENSSSDRISEFELKLIDFEAEHLGIPDKEYKAIIQMPSSEFQRICRDMSVLGESCIISCTKEGVKFSVSGDIGNGNVILKPTSTVDNKEQAVIVEMEEPVELSFSLRYLTLFTKATPISPVVKLSLTENMPIVVEYTIENTGSLRYYLAPKVDGDE